MRRITLSFSACVMVVVSVLTVDSPSAAAQGIPAQSQLPPRIEIGTGDLIDLKVLDVPELSQSVRVDDVGNATFLLIGRVHLGGLTSEQSQDLIADRYTKADFLVNPKIAVFIREYATQGVSVYGEVFKPGVYQVLGRRTFLSVLSEAGGITPTAANEAKVERTDGSISTVTLSRDPDVSLANDIELYPGDKVIVARAGIVYVLGDVYRAGGYVMQNGGNLTILEAVAMASGVQSTAALNSAKLIRKQPSGFVKLVPIALKRIMEGKESDQQMQAEDILFIPNSMTKSIGYRSLPIILAATSSAAVYGALR